MIILTEKEKAWMLLQDGDVQLNPPVQMMMGLFSTVVTKFPWYMVKPVDHIEVKFELVDQT